MRGSLLASGAQEIRHQAGPFVATLARVGFAAKGILYVVVGALAAMSAFGSGGRTTGTRGALETLFEQPFGRVMLGIVAIGLAGFTLFQLIRAIWDPEHEGGDARGVAVRIGFFFSGLLHGSLCVAAVGVLFRSRNSGDSGGDAQAQSWTASLMAQPWGRWLVAAVGAGVVGYGIFQLVQAWKAKLDDQLVLEGKSAQAGTAVRRICRFGIASRGVVFAIIGALLMLAAWKYDPSEAKGLGGALNTLAQQRFGPWLLGLVALGLVSYGIYQFLLARYRRIRT